MQRSSTFKQRWSCQNPESAMAMRSTLIERQEAGSPLLMMYAEKDGYRSSVSNPNDDRVYETNSDLSTLEERIDLPPLESLKGSLLKIERVGEDKVRDILISDLSRGAPHTAEDLRGRLWVGDKKEDYVVVWHFEMNGILII
ncbi:unnamed protein product [Arabidopsis thaliana]|uniref:(thale cress) hypothetical protein n=1 Tax=Arabidopsis thaliana TaxID=3702 RepID=A0A7G2DZ86_ARATH|nr:unnamed protein product [Arabidopsis thaliana]